MTERIWPDTLNHSKSQRPLFTDIKIVKRASEIIKGILETRSPRISDIASRMEGGEARMNRITQRLSRLRAHQNLATLCETVPFHTKQIIEGLLETGATYPLMEKAGQCMDAEFQANAILQILANGNVRSLDAVTEAALDELEYLLTTVVTDDE